MRIQVSEQHIEHGLRGSCTKDPIALALRDAGFMHPWVSVDYIEVDGFNGGFKRQHWSSPESVRNFIADFDAFRFIDPFEFELE